jgi:hypothetical protein
MRTALASGVTILSGIYVTVATLVGPATARPLAAVFLGLLGVLLAVVRWP